MADRAQIHIAGLSTASKAPNVQPAVATPGIGHKSRYRNHQHEATILLASKRFWNDAAPILWKENWFAFEDPPLLTGFLTAIRPQVRSWLKRISFMPLHPYLTSGIPSSTDTWVPGSIWNGWDDIENCWGLLRLCEGLTELELDVVFLTRKEWAQAIRLISVKKQVTFLRQMNSEDVDYVTEDSWNLIWKSHVRRKRFDSPTTALLASSMTGDRAIKRKVLLNYYSESTPHQRCGDYGVKFTEDMNKGRRRVS
ncbi:hypothetical protein DTO013E5_6969 [Penicillium roqueforti]|nr:hypothetical protein CBS147372_3544 [Penicillium roqueforti]KAI2738838.1 hypothetical protein DTO012A1_6539 [Penicillium roqueforti]KAI2750542.1 hypothetical protein DTO013F2_4611 [Penicillium roqueforti]KAI2765286.1 hypothetical protein DTO012A8_9493 [Penicillium roqueforti]KAI3067756.1 hypothetical protein CBS147339_8367 [Penicillium roqueforti]